MSGQRRRPRAATTVTEPAPAPVEGAELVEPVTPSASVEVEHHTAGQTVAWSRYRYPTTQRVVLDVGADGVVAVTYEVLAALLSEAGYEPQIVHSPTP